MKPTKQKRDNTSYLDVSEFIMKDHSPVFKPKPHSQLLQNIISPQLLISEVSPILEAKVHFPITPIFDRTKSDPLRQAIFDELQDFSLDGQQINSVQKKNRKPRPRLSSLYHIVDNELENIIEEPESQGMEYAESQQMENSENIQPDLVQQEEQISDSDENQNEREKQSTTNFELSQYEFRSVEWQVANPKKQLISKIKVIVAEAQSSGTQEKFGKIKDIILKYLCEYEKYYFDESMELIRRAHTELSEMVEIVLKGIDQTFKKIIGGLSFQKRRVKLLRYLEKKKRRVWKKKVNYDCRKKVADGRLRIKGKFVTHQQACQQLGLANLQGYNPSQIKQMLQKKMDNK